MFESREHQWRALYSSIRRHGGLRWSRRANIRIGQGGALRKLAILGGGGVRTPLIIHGLVQSQDRLRVGQVVLFDLDAERAETIARIGREIIRSLGGRFE